jgi:Holliday junction resolvase RusA-like endonuclease
VLKVTAPLLPRPDVDNVAKSVMDALIGVAYQDDTLVMSLRAQKQYGTEDYVIVRVQHAE